MKGYVYYTKAESVRNHAFIDDLIRKRRKSESNFSLLVDDEQPDADADFILFHGS